MQCHRITILSRLIGCKDITTKNHISSNQTVSHDIEKMWQLKGVGKVKFELFVLTFSKIYLVNSKGCWRKMSHSKNIIRKSSLEMLQRES